MTLKLKISDTINKVKRQVIDWKLQNGNNLQGCDIKNIQRIPANQINKRKVKKRIKEGCLGCSVG